MNPFTEEELRAASTLAGDHDWRKAWEQLLQPLHQRLVTAQSFDILDELPTVPGIMLLLDYIDAQVSQGGFIQLFQNGYAPLLLDATESLAELNPADEMIQILDEALKEFSIHIETLGREHSVEDFARLYKDFPQFEPLEKEYLRILPELKIKLIKSVTGGG